MTPTPTLRRLAVLLLCSAPLAAQDPQKPEWPHLDDAQLARARVLAEALNGDDEAAATAAETELAGLGAGIEPMMVVRLGNTKTTRQANTIAGVLDAAVPAEYAPLVAEHARDRHPEVRRWSIGWLARHPAEAQRDALEHATEDKDEIVAFRASAGLVALGSIDDLQRVFETCKEDWPTHAEFVAAVLPAARGTAAADWVLARMPADDVRARITGLRLLRNLAPKEYAGKIVPYLDAEQHAVKKEAVNALRGIVDGDAPLEDLSVFQVIDLAKKWKARV